MKRGCLCLAVLWLAGLNVAGAAPAPGSLDLIYQIPLEFTTAQVAGFDTSDVIVLAGKTSSGDMAWTRARAGPPPEPLVVLDPSFDPRHGVHYQGGGRFLSLRRRDEVGDYVVQRHLPDGSIDPTFQEPDSANDAPETMKQLIVMRDDGGFWLATNGLTFEYNGFEWVEVPNSFVMRYDIDGNFIESAPFLRESFVDWFLPTSDSAGLYRSVFVGQPLLGNARGDLGEQQPPYSSPFLDSAGRFIFAHGARFLPSGDFDPSFDAFGRPGRAVDEFADGRLLVIGFNTISRGDANGRFDATFQAPQRIGGRAFNPSSAHVLADGKVLAFGTANGKPVMVRLHGGTADPSPPTVAWSPLSQTVKFSHSLRLKVGFASVPQADLQWSKDGVPIPGATQSSLEFAEIEFDDAGTYSVIATNEHGTAASDPAVIDVVPLQPGDPDPTFSTDSFDPPATFSAMAVVDDHILLIGTREPVSPLFPGEPLFAIADPNGQFLGEFGLPSTHGDLRSEFGIRHAASGAPFVWIDSEYGPTLYRVDTDPLELVAFRGVIASNITPLSDGGLIQSESGFVERINPDGSTDLNFSLPSWVDHVVQQLENGNLEVAVNDPPPPLQDPGIYEMTLAGAVLPGHFRPFPEPGEEPVEENTDSAGRTVSWDASARAWLRFLPDGTRDYSFRPDRDFNVRSSISDFLSDDSVITLRAGSGELVRLTGGDLPATAPIIDNINFAPIHLSKSYPTHRPLLSLWPAVMASPQPTLQWHFNGEPIPGANTPRLGRYVDYSDVGTYSLVATNALGTSEIAIPFALYGFNEFEFDGTRASLQIPTVSGRSYQLQSSTDLGEWTDLGEPVDGDNGPHMFEDFPAAGDGRKIYRAKVVR